MLKRSDTESDNKSHDSIVKPEVTQPSDGMSHYEFILKARRRHGSMYDYSKVPHDTLYSDTMVTIECHKHGVFTQTVQSHLSVWSGCVKCHSYASNVARLKHEHSH